MPDPTPPPDAPDDEVLRALLAGALAGDALAAEARALAEVGRDLAALADEAPEALRDNVRAAALAAWAVGAAGEAAPDLQARPPVVRGPVPLARPIAGRVPAVHLVRWAALLLAGLGLTLLAVLFAPEEATAGLRLGSLFRVDQVHGRQEARSGREIPWGEHIQAAEHEVLGFRLPEGSAVVLRGAGRLRPVRAPDGGPVLTLEEGVVQVAVAPGSEVRLALGDLRLRLLQGRAWADGRHGSLSLGPTGRAWLAVAGAGDRLLDGPWDAGTPRRRGRSRRRPSAARGAVRPAVRPRRRPPRPRVGTPGRGAAVAGGRRRGPPARHEHRPRGGRSPTGVAARAGRAPGPDAQAAARGCGGSHRLPRRRRGPRPCAWTGARTCAARRAGTKPAARRARSWWSSCVATEPGARNARFLGASFVTDRRTRTETSRGRGDRSGSPRNGVIMRRYESGSARKRSANAGIALLDGDHRPGDAGHRRRTVRHLDAPGPRAHDQRAGAQPRRVRVEPAHRSR